MSLTSRHLSRICLFLGVLAIVVSLTSGNPLATPTDAADMVTASITP